MYVRMCMYVCMHVCMYACMYVCIHAYIHTYICRKARETQVELYVYIMHYVNSDGKRPRLLQGRLVSRKAPLPLLADVFAWAGKGWNEISMQGRALGFSDYRYVFLQNVNHAGLQSNLPKHA